MNVNPKLYTFVDTGYLRERSPETLTQQLCDGGSDLIQLRAKDWPREQIRAVAEKLLKITRSAGVDLVINDHWDLAAQLGAPYCHLGQEDFFDAGFSHASQLPIPSPAPSLQPPAPCSTKLGLSTHAPAQADRAIAAGADYIAIGPVFPTRTKPGAKPVTLDYVRWAAAHVPIPWFAIGGITLENLEPAMEAGARRICVVSAILNSPDVVRACRAFKAKLETGS